MRVDSDLCRPLTHIRDTCSNMSVLIRRSYPIKRISRSSRPRRSSARPSHHECGIVSCVSRGVRNGRAKDHPHPLRTSHKRPAERSLPSRHRSRRTARAQNRRCDATTRRMMALSATAWSTWMMCVMPERWSRSRVPPFTCSLHQLPAGSKPAPRRSDTVERCRAVEL